MRYCITTLLMFSSIYAYANQPLSQHEIEERIKPIGSVRIAKSNEQASKANANGQTTYEKYCILCHQNGVAGAPKFRDESSWKPRLEQQNIDTLVASALKGKNAMPPKGTCQECTDSDIKAAIEYMVPQK